jgi:WD40 repeat protein
MNPLQRLVSIRKGVDGARMCDVQTGTVTGAIWDVQMSADGQYAGITTGDNSLYRVTLGYGETTPTFTHWPLDGIGNSVDLTAHNTYIAAGTWDQTGVSCYALKGDGTPTWEFPNDRTPPETRQALEHRLFEAQFTTNGRFVLGLSYDNARQSDGTLYLWRCDGDGTPLWSHPLGLNTFFPKALISQDGQTVAVTYVRMIAQGSRTVPERSLLVMNGDGQVLWEKGGLWFSPTLVAIAPDGHRVTVSDGVRMLYNVNSSGRITTPYQFKGTATSRQTVSTPDGGSLLVYTSDGWLHLVQIG